ncbi:MAG: hypothetical protein IJN57_04605 [Oscillospiraceae bacterium]|nr:hypothetical protein [Oscillospiraceae bacterium]
MKMRRIAAGALLTAAMTASMMGLEAAAEWQSIGYRGDINQDGSVSVVDIVMLQRNILALDVLPNETAARFADMNDDNKVNGIDLGILKRCVLRGEQFELWADVTEPSTEPTEPSTEPTEPSTEPTEPSTEPTEPPIQSTEAFYDAPIAEVDAGLPSQGTGNLVIFYVDFPDCRYTTDFTAEQIEQMAFGEENPASACYPFESMSAFYARSSKGALDLNGTVFRYTAKENRAVYDNDKVKIVEECYEAFKDSVDFSQYDGDGDGKIDATLITVPTAAGDDAWWPCAGDFGDPYYAVDGKNLGHLITGNAEIISTGDYKNFVSSYLHEMGHCMGLPDYYLYNSNDYEAFHGDAGQELMDVDAYSDFGCFSKLMLGWYRRDQVQVYDSSAGSQTFLLNSAQTDQGNCVIIPYGTLDGQFFSEYFMIEYITDDDNNCGINRDISWWQKVSEGVRVFHVKADLQRDYWYTYLKYQNGSEFCGGNDDGIRLIRLVGDGQGVFTTGSVIGSGTSGFGWYDSSENESINPGVTITVGDLVNGQYSVTVSNQ